LTPGFIVVYTLAFYKRTTGAVTAVQALHVSPPLCICYAPNFGATGTQLPSSWLPLDGRGPRLPFITPRPVSRSTFRQPLQYLYMGPWRSLSVVKDQRFLHRGHFTFQVFFSNIESPTSSRLPSGYMANTAHVNPKYVPCALVRVRMPSSTRVRRYCRNSGGGHHVRETHRI